MEAAPMEGALMADIGSQRQFSSCSVCGGRAILLPVLVSLLKQSTSSYSTRYRLCWTHGYQLVDELKQLVQVYA